MADMSPNWDCSDDDSHLGAIEVETRSRPGGHGEGGRARADPLREHPRPPSAPAPSGAAGSAGADGGAAGGNPAPTTTTSVTTKSWFLAHDETGDLSPLGKWSE